MAQIGFIGLGNMGLPMAQNLIKAGHAVCGYDVSAAALDRFSAAGGIAVRSLDVASMGVDLIISMLPPPMSTSSPCSMRRSPAALPARMPGP
jgi:3-hydroxyisobutyrate dehydrogenase